ncbi:hypothetical protein UK82_15205 [Frankia sp. ACN1ag]|nr:hypothetical protein UK82_15205 [Frankia sp. ACN1ag]
MEIPCQVTPFGGKDVDDLPDLVDRPVQVGPPAGDLDVGFVDEPPVSRAGSARPGSLDEQRSEPLDPAVDRGVIDGDAAFREQLLDVAVGQAVPQVPADDQDDHLGWEPEPDELRNRLVSESLGTEHSE